VKQLEACVHILPSYSAFLGQGLVKHYNARAWAQLEGQAGLSQLLSRSHSSSWIWEAASLFGISSVRLGSEPVSAMALSRLQAGAAATLVGLAQDLGKPEPSKARPKLGLSGWARPGTSLLEECVSEIWCPEVASRGAESGLLLIWKAAQQWR